MLDAGNTKEEETHTRCPRGAYDDAVGQAGIRPVMVRNEWRGARSGALTASRRPGKEVALALGSEG